MPPLPVFIPAFLPVIIFPPILPALPFFMTSAREASTILPAIPFFILFLSFPWLSAATHLLHEAVSVGNSIGHLLSA